MGFRRARVDGTGVGVAIALTAGLALGACGAANAGTTQAVAAVSPSSPRAWGFSGGAPSSGAKATNTVPAGMPTSTSLQGWHVSKTGTVAISKTVGDPHPPSLRLPGDGQSYVWADLGKPVNHFSFDVFTQGLFDFFFGANDSGQGYMFRIDTRGSTDYSGFTTSMSWLKWNCPGKGPTTDPASQWLHVGITIQGTNVTAKVTGKAVNQSILFAAPSIVSCTTSGNPQVLVAYKPVGTAFGFQGDGLGATSATWIANFK